MQSIRFANPRRITDKTLKIKQLSNKDGCFFLLCSRQKRVQAEIFVFDQSHKVR